MDWKIAQAKKNFSQLVRSTDSEPQLIYNRDRLVAAMVAPSDLEELERYRQHDRSPKTLAEALAPLRKVIDETGEELEIPPRSAGRPNAFLEVLDELPD